MPKRPFFISSCGTHVGKTLITAALTWQLRDLKKEVLALKPVISGFNGQDMHSDTAIILRSLGKTADFRAIEYISPWRFKAPVSPHHAAALEGISLDAKEIASYCKGAMKSNAVMLVEGAGGVMAPLNAHETMLDVMQALNARVIVVAGSYLGSISHTLTALEALKSRSLTIAGMVVSESADPAMDMAETLDILRSQTVGKYAIAPVARLSAQEDTYRFVPSLTHLLEPFL